MSPELYLIIIMHVILLNTKARVNVVEREQPTMLSVDSDILKKQRRMTMFHCSCVQNIKWYKWDGSYELRNVMEIIPK